MIAACGLCVQAVNFHLFLDEKTFTYPVHIALIKQRFTPNMKNWTPLIAEVIEPNYVDSLLKKRGSEYWTNGVKVTEQTSLLNWMLLFLVI